MIPNKPYPPSTAAKSSGCSVRLQRTIRPSASSSRSDSTVLAIGGRSFCHPWQFTLREPPTVNGLSDCMTATDSPRAERKGMISSHLAPACTCSKRRDSSSSIRCSASMSTTIPSRTKVCPPMLWRAPGQADDAANRGGIEPAGILDRIERPSRRHGGEGALANGSSRDVNEGTGKSGSREERDAGGDSAPADPPGAGSVHYVDLPDRNARRNFASQQSWRAALSWKRTGASLRETTTASTGFVSAAVTTQPCPGEVASTPTITSDPKETRSIAIA